jgi:clan AA aspartic protease
MMVGTVNADLEARLRLSIQDAQGHPHEVETVVDTGFNGFLTLPPALVVLLGLPWLCRQQGQLADGSLQAFDVYAAKVDWAGRLRTVEVEAVDAQPLIGMALMQGSELRVQVVQGGPVTVAGVTMP